MRQFHDLKIEMLKKPEFAAEYLNTYLEDGTENEFLTAIKNVAEAQGGLSKLASKTKLNRANLYRIFSKKGNPEIQTLVKILDSLGLRLAVASD
jgi:probable addiction module antidote protein